MIEALRDEYFPTKTDCVLPDVLLDICLSYLVEIKRAYHTNGRVWTETPYVDGKIHGVHRWWHSNGQICYEAPHVSGEKHGLQKWWDMDGQLIAEIPYTDGKPSGLCK